tara:strand:- start:133 stop:396 length:264 start_codon:yes stop_codon:yes gene_type:complete
MKNGKKFIKKRHFFALFSPEIPRNLPPGFWGGKSNDTRQNCIFLKDEFYYFSGGFCDENVRAEKFLHKKVFFCIFDKNVITFFFGGY